VKPKDVEEFEKGYDKFHKKARSKNFKKALTEAKEWPHGNKQFNVYYSDEAEAQPSQEEQAESEEEKESASPVEEAEPIQSEEESECEPTQLYNSPSNEKHKQPIKDDIPLQTPAKTPLKTPNRHKKYSPLQLVGITPKKRKKQRRK